MLSGAWIALVSAMLLVVPGALLGRRLSLSWPVAVAAASPLTLSLVGITTVVYANLGTVWTPVTALVALALWMLIAWSWERFGPAPQRIPPTGGPIVATDDAPDPPLSGRGILALLAGVAIGAITILVTSVRPVLTAAPGGLDNIPQIWDALWHASSLRWIAETGNGSSLRMGELMNQDTSGFNFYPNAWHGLGAVASDLTGANTVALYNVFSPATLGITVPVGVAGLTYWMARHRMSTERSAYLAAIGAAMPALFPSLPYVEITLTSVPNAVGVSMAPIAAILVIGAVADRRRILPAALSIAGVTATHPSGLVLIGVIVGFWWLLEGLVHPVRGRWRDLVPLLVTGLLALVAITPVVYGTLKIAGNDELSGFEFRDESASMAEALRQGAFNGTVPLDLSYPVWPLVICSVIGLAVMVWLRCSAAIATWILFVLLAANSVVALGPADRLLGTIGGYFYNSGHRLTFVTAMFSAAAAALAVGMVALAVSRAGSNRAGSNRAGANRTGANRAVPQPGRWASTVAVGIVLAVIVGSAVWSYDDNSTVASRHRDGRLVDPDTVAAFEWLDEQDDAHSGVVLNNLDQGTGWMYPVTGLMPMFPFYRANDFSDRQRDLFWGVSRIGADPHVDALVDELDVRYVIDSPPSYWDFQNGPPDPERGHQGDPFLALRESTPPGLVEVFRQGDTTVYRVVGTE